MSFEEDLCKDAESELFIGENDTALEELELLKFSFENGQFAKFNDELVSQGEDVYQKLQSYMGNYKTDLGLLAKNLVNFSISAADRFSLAKDLAEFVIFDNNFFDLFEPRERFQLVEASLRKASAKTIESYPFIENHSFIERLQLSNKSARLNPISTAKNYKKFGLDYHRSDVYVVLDICLAESRVKHEVAKYADNFLNGDIDNLYIACCAFIEKKCFHHTDIKLEKMTKDDQYSLAKHASKDDYSNLEKYLHRFDKLTHQDCYSLAISSLESGMDFCFRSIFNYAKFSSEELISLLENTKKISENTLFYIESKEILRNMSNEQRYQAALIMNLLEPTVVANHLSLFEPLTRQQIISLYSYAALHNDGMFLYEIENIPLSARDQFELAKILIKIAPIILADNLNKFQALNARQTYELVKQIARENVYVILKNYKDYCLSDSHGDYEYEMLKYFVALKPNLMASSLYVFSKFSNQRQYEIASWYTKNLSELFIENIQQLSGLTEIQLAGIAECYLKNNPLIIAKNIKKFPVFNAHEKYELAKVYAKKSTMWFLDDFHNFVDMYRNHQIEIAKICVEKSPRRTVENIVGGHWRLKKENISELFYRACYILLAGRRWDMFNKLITQHSGIIKEKNRKQFLANLYHQLTIEENLLESNLDKRYLAILDFIIQCDFAPSSVLEEGLMMIGNHEKFVNALFYYNSQSTVENVLKVILKIYYEYASFDEDEASLVLEFLDSRYNGFSFEAFKIYRQIPTRAEREQQLVVWKNLSYSILHGQPVSCDNDFILPSLIDDAYKPTGMSVETIKHYLFSVNDNSHHMLTWQYPQEGFDLKVHQKLSKKQPVDEALSLKVKDLLKCLNITTKPNSSDVFMTLLVRTAKSGCLSEQDKNILIHYLCHHPDGVSIKSTLRDVKKLYDQEKVFDILPTLQEVFDLQIIDVIKQHCENVFSQTKNSSWLATLKKSLLKRNKKHVHAQDEAIIAALLGCISKSLSQDAQYFKKQNIAASYLRTGSEVSLKGYVIKDQASFFSRAGAGLCTATDLWSWNNPDFMQIVLIDPTAKEMVGNIQLHRFTYQNEPCLLARFNPNMAFLRTADYKSLAYAMVKMTYELSLLNKLDLYLPEQSSYHELTNRGVLAPYLREYVDRTKIFHSFQITGNHSVRVIHRVNAHRFDKDVIN